MGLDVSTKAKMGRPSDYQDKYAKIAMSMCKLGATDVQMAEAFGVSERTLNTWKKKHPDFLQALKAKSDPDDLVEKSLFERALGFEYDEVTQEDGTNGSKTVTKNKRVAGDTTAMIFWLKNRRPDRWREKQEIEQTGDDLSSAVNKLIDKLPN